jgi:hypothetical protein
VSVEVGDGEGVAVGVEVGVLVGVDVSVLVGVEVTVGEGVTVVVELGVEVGVRVLEGAGEGDGISTTCVLMLSEFCIACEASWLPHAVRKPIRRRESPQ